jgi:hypothetical protein
MSPSLGKLSTSTSMPTYSFSDSLYEFIIYYSIIKQTEPNEPWCSGYNEGKDLK